jgi:molecular chaperone GrpE
MLNKLKEYMTNHTDSDTPKKNKKSKSNHDNEDLTNEIEVLKKELEESKDKYLRLFAEFDNFKKRNIKERFEILKTAAQDTIQAMLPILDDFDRAKKSAETSQSGEIFSEGVQLVYNKLYHTLEQKGLKAMESTGMNFDPEFHEAITDIPAPSEDMIGKIIDTVEKGYMLSDKIIRHAKVVVGK